MTQDPTDKAKPTEKNGSGHVFTIAFGHLAHDTYSAFLGPMLPFLIEKLGLSLAAAGLLDVIRRIPSMLTPLIGFLADRMDFKLIVIATPAVTALCMSLLGIAPNYFSLALLIFIAGISAALFHIPSPVIIKKVAPKRIASGMGYYMFGGELARTLGPLFITAAIAEWGLEGSLKTLPPGLLASAILFYKLKDLKLEPPKRKEQASLFANTSKKTLVRLFMGIGGFLLFQAGLKAVMTVFLTTYLIQQGSSIWFAGIALSVLQLSGAISTIFTGHLAERYGCRKILMVAAIMTPLTAHLFLQFPKFQIATLIFLGIFLFMPGPVILTLVQKLESDRPAFVNSLYMTTTFTISAIMTYLVGYSGDLNGLTETLQLFIWLSFVSLPIAYLLKSN